MLPLLKRHISTLALIVSLTTAGFTLVQLIDAKRTISLNSLATIKEGYSEPKMQFYAWMFDNAMSFVDTNKGKIDRDPFIESLGILYITEYLRSIEFVCDAYLQDLLGKEAKIFVTNYVKSDIEGLLLYFYDEKKGTIGVDDDINVKWIKPSDSNPSENKLESYPSTLRCVTEWEIRLKGKSIF